jgi:hypothetical protein
MEPQHELNELFLQLGLPEDADAIDGFVAAHRPLDANVALADAPFWTRSQSAFICEEIARDADWAELIDRLDVMLRS